MNKKGFIHIALVLGIGLVLAVAGGYFAYKFGLYKSEESSNLESGIEEGNTISTNNEGVESENGELVTEPSTKPLTKDDSFTSIETDIKNTTILEEDFSDL